MRTKHQPSLTDRDLASLILICWFSLLLVVYAVLYCEGSLAPALGAPHVVLTVTSGAAPDGRG
jgi:hypothetical protein